MIAEIEAHRAEIEQLCRRHRVRRLELFGSAVSGRFDDKTSDLDFLVDFSELEPTAYADTYFGLKEALEELFNRPVDLVMVAAVKNPYFLQELAETKVLLYAA